MPFAYPRTGHFVGLYRNISAKPLQKERFDTAAILSVAAKTAIFREEARLLARGLRIARGAENPWSVQ
jgi:hypothetical protein